MPWLYNSTFYAKDMSCIVYDQSRLYIQFFLGVKDCIFSLLFPAYEYLSYTSDRPFLPPTDDQPAN